MKTADLVIGRWDGILSLLGIDSQYLTGRHTACPCCGGKDRFRYDNLEGKGTFFCSHCGAGTGWKLLELFHGWTFKQAAREVEAIIGTVSVKPIKKPPELEHRRKRLQALYQRYKPIYPGDPVFQYLAGRGMSSQVIHLISDQLGFIPDMEYWQDGSLSGRYDAMVGVIRKGNKPVSFHVTYLDDGKKAKIRDCRKILPAIEKTSGGAVELFPHEGRLGVAEGIETALAATKLTGISTWAVMNAIGLKSFIAPSCVSNLHIFADNDANYVGQQAAFSLAERLNKKIKVSVHIPERVDTDWNDYIQTESEWIGS